TISSKVITEELSIGETKKEDLDSDNVYDLELKYEEYKSTLGKLFLKEISEAVPTRDIQTTSAVGNDTASEINENEDQTGSGTGASILGLINKLGKTGKIIFWIVFGAIMLVILVGIVYFKRDDLKEMKLVKKVTARLNTASKK
ncbi:MAG TPA: hypothetical protein VJ438_00005, partial [Candidatus Nanoarchaeia archaeon]|nr:hypothetical protein [Candidatus Nanoarchaeia archaeon]